MFKNSNKLIKCARSTINVQFVFSTYHNPTNDQIINKRINLQFNHLNDRINNENKSTRNQKSKPKKSSTHPFKNLYPWTSLDEFADYIERRVVFNDKNLIAIDKPWGIAYHKANKTLHKPYSFETLSLIAGEPKFCLDDALSHLEERLEVEKLEYVKTIDKYSSGIILLAGNKTAKSKIQYSFHRNKSEGRLYYDFLCIAQGFPAIQGDELGEKVRIKLRDLDELADYKEPIIVSPRKTKDPNDKGYLTRVNLKINSINKQNSTSFLKILTNQMRWNFVRCYVANKTAFVIGDLRFSANVKRILGQTVLETTNSFYKNNRIEPLNKDILNDLKVKTNRKIPLMLHLNSISLRKYNKADEITIRSKKLPEYFQYALDKLKLNNVKETTALKKDD